MQTIARPSTRGRRLRAAAQKVGVIAVFGALGIGGSLATTISPSSAAPKPSDPKAFGTDPPASYNPSTLTDLSAQCPEGIAGTPGSDPATKFLNTALNTETSVQPGGVVHYYYQDNPNFAAENFQIDDCVATYPESTFASSDFNSDGQLVGNVPKSVLNGGNKIDAASFSGILDSQAKTYFNWTAPSTLTPGEWVCNFARDIATGHGGGGNRKVLPTCYQVVGSVTPAAPTHTVNTACGVQDTYTIPETTGVTYKVNGTATTAGTYNLAAGVTVVITAEPNAHYVFPSSATREWSFTGSTVETCTEPLTPAAPTHTVNTACGVQDTYTIPAMEGVAYKVDGTTTAAGTYNLAANVTVVITAEASGSTPLADNATKSWSYTGSEVPACTTTVRPLAPTQTVNTACGVQDTYTVPTTTGVTYNPVPGTYNLGAGQAVHITATPNSGYVFPEGATSQWDFTGSTIETCGGGGQDIPVITTTTTTTTAPTTTTTEAPTTTVPELAFTQVPAVAAATTTTTAAPVVEQELAFTGSNDTQPLLLMGLSMFGLGGLCIMASRRRRTA